MRSVPRELCSQDLSLHSWTWLDLKYPDLDRKANPCDANTVRDTVRKFSTMRSTVRGWEAFAEFWYGTSRPNYEYWLGFSTSRLQKRED